MIINSDTILAATAVLTTVGGAWATVRKSITSFNKRRAIYRQSILDQAKQEMNLVKQGLEAKIKEVEIELENQKEAVSKDIGHMKFTYNSEIKMLGQRIEELRQDLLSQHSSLVSLLTKLVDK